MSIVGSVILSSGGGAGGWTVNEETLAGNKTIADGDPEIQILDPNGTSRDVVLPAAPAEGSVFDVRNANVSGNAARLNVKVGADTTAFAEISAGQTAFCVYTANGWITFGQGWSSKRTAANTFEDRDSTTLGHDSETTGLNGTALGNQATSGVNGLAVGLAASASNTGAALGYSSEANQNDSIAIGRDAVVNRVGEVAMNNEFTSDNKAATTIQKYMGDTTNATQTEIFLVNRSGSRCTVLASSVIGFTGMIVARENATQDSKVWEVKGAIKRDNANNTSLVGTITKTVIGADAGASAWDVDVNADDTNEALRVQVTGEASHTIQWGATLYLSERRN